MASTPHYHRQGYTLIELVVSAALASVVTAGLAGSLYVAGQALAPGGGAADKLAADVALAELHRDVQTALSFSELTATSVSLSVPDRTGDGLTDTLRYAWSGTAGDPLTRSLNGADATIVAPNVQAFSLSWLTRLIEGVSTRPVVLFVSSQAPDANSKITPTADEQLRLDLLDAWGFDHELIGQGQAVGVFTAALNDANVVYVPGSVSDTALADKVTAAPIGVVTELIGNAARLGLHAPGEMGSQWTASVRVDTASHYITSVLPASEVTIANQETWLNSCWTEIDYDAQVLASVQSGQWFPSLMCVDQNALLANGAQAPARRVHLPWGVKLDFAAINESGHTIMRRAVEWAAGAGLEEADSGVSFENFSQAIAGSNVQSVTVAVPAGTAAGDLLIAMVALDGSPTNVQMASAGWKALAMGNQNGQVVLGVWWKIATASESDYQLTWTNNEQAIATVLRFTGHHPTAPVPVVATAGGTSNAPTAPAVTTTSDNCLILRLCGLDDRDVTVGSTGLAGHTDIFAERSSILLGIVSSAAGYYNQATAGTAAATNFALTGSEEWRTVTIAIAPAPEATP